jgi:hypothetical protein
MGNSFSNPFFNLSPPYIPPPPPPADNTAQLNLDKINAANKLYDAQAKLNTATADKLAAANKVSNINNVIATARNKANNPPVVINPVKITTPSTTISSNNTNDTIDICKPIESIINNNIKDPLNTFFKDCASNINTATSAVKSGIVTCVGGVDDILSQSTKGVNTAIKEINNIAGIFPKTINFFLGFFTENVLDFIKSVISLIIVYTVPSSLFYDLSFYTSLTLIILIFVFIIFPILCIILFILWIIF